MSRLSVLLYTDLALKLAHMGAKDAALAAVAEMRKEGLTPTFLQRRDLLEALSPWTEARALLPSALCSALALWLTVCVRADPRAIGSSTGTVFDEPAKKGAACC